MAIIWKYKFTVGFLVSVAFTLTLSSWGVFDAAARAVQSYGTLGSLIAGIMFSSVFTAVPATFLLAALGQTLPPLLVIALGGVGAMIGDMLMYHALKNGVMNEILLIATAVFPQHRRERMEQITKSRVFVWLVPLIASTLIASPLPDEVGIALFSLINFRPKYLSIISLILNMIGITAIVLISRAIGV